MKEILVLIALCAAAYFFRNYQTFREANLRPLAVQWNYDREGDPQALCDLLAPTATVKINDQFPRFDRQFTGYKEQACKYFQEAASHFAKPHTEKNGYITDRLKQFAVSNIDYVKGTADLEYVWRSDDYYIFGLQPKKGNGTQQYVGNTKTKMKLRLRPFEDLQATYYEFTRKFELVEVRK